MLVVEMVISVDQMGKDYVHRLITCLYTGRQQLSAPKNIHYYANLECPNDRCPSFDVFECK